MSYQKLPIPSKWNSHFAALFSPSVPWSGSIRPLVVTRIYPSVSCHCDFTCTVPSSWVTLLLPHTTNMLIFIYSLKLFRFCPPRKVFLAPRIIYIPIVCAPKHSTFASITLTNCYKVFEEVLVIFPLSLYCLAHNKYTINFSV